MQSMKPAQLAFFSYAHEETEFALRLAKDLRAGGAAVWMDRLDIKPGQRWDSAIEDALAKCPQLLVILSPAAVESTNVMDEVSLALEEGKTVLPVIYRNCKIPFRLRRLQYVDLTLNYEAGLGRLLETLDVAAPGTASASRVTASEEARAIQALPSTPAQEAIKSPPRPASSETYATASQPPVPEEDRGRKSWAILGGSLAIALFVALVLVALFWKRHDEVRPTRSQPGVGKTLGYITGHKEPPLSENSPISVLKTFIENENIKFQELNLLDPDAIPADVKVFMIVGPQYDFSDHEMKRLRDFWDKHGRILLLLDPTAKTPKLRGFVSELGVKPNDDRLIDRLRVFWRIQELAPTGHVQAHFVGNSPITKRLADVRTLFLGGTSSLTLEPDLTANIRVEPVIQAEKDYFAEKDYNTDDQAKLQADAKQSSNVPLTIGAAVEKGGSADQRIQVNSSRLVVVSNATFVQDNAITQNTGLNFITGSVNWLLSP